MIPIDIEVENSSQPRLWAFLVCGQKQKKEEKTAFALTKF